ncbi:MAG: sigma-70 family RNA polymerase sigma factor [Myxococcota bacterium]|nr:sigma-70 family RNA polymerase sigma factor [Myxococcota bacterium]
MSQSPSPKSNTHVPINRDLLSRCMADDRNAREALARACLPRVRRTVLLTTGGHQDTEDLIQSAMIRIFAGLNSFKNDGGFIPWLDKVTINTVRQYYRRHPLSFFTKPSDEIQSQLQAPALDRPDHQLEGHRVFSRLCDHLSALRPKKRYAVVLAAAYGYTSKEAADLMDCTLETAKKRLQHGRRELVYRLRKDRYVSEILKEIDL